MIVPAMTEWEVVRDAVKDFPALNRKMQRPMELLARRHKKGDRKAVLDEIHAYHAPTGNNLYVVLRYCKAGIQIFHFAWYRGRDGHLRAVYVRENGSTAFHFSYHVFVQYSSRFSPDVTAQERMRQFFLNNYMYVCHEVDPLADEREVITSVNQGWLFGVMDEEENLLYLTTFVDQGKFFPNQHRLEERLEFERSLGGLTPGQKAQVLAKLKETPQEEEWLRKAS